MSNIRTKRRRVRQTSPEVLKAIHDAAIAGASAPEIVRALTRRQKAGEFGDTPIPSERTVSNVAREVAPDDSGPWGISDADPATISLVLEVLAEVVRRTEGDVAALTRRQARLIPVVYRAMEPRWTKLPDGARAWQSYVWTRFCLSWSRSERDEQEIALLMAAMQSDGKWPLPAWQPIERVSAAATGWLPSELVEVNR